MFAVVIASLLYFCDKTRVHDLKIKECEDEGSLCPLEIHSLSLPVASEPASKGPQAQVSLTLRVTISLPPQHLEGRGREHWAERSAQSLAVWERFTSSLLGCPVHPSFITWLPADCGLLGPWGWGRSRGSSVSPCHSQEMSTRLVFKASSQHVTYAKQKQLLFGQQTGEGYIIIIIIGANICWTLTVYQTLNYLLVFSQVPNAPVRSLALTHSISALFSS